jgi:ribulose bisphosphate carboxylase small subunit
MNSEQLEQEQKLLKARLSADPEYFGVHGIAEAKQRVTVREALKVARRLRLKKRSSHRRYLALKKSKKVLTRSVQEELRSLLAEFHALNVEMADARRTLRGIRETREQTSRYFQDGYKLGVEHAAVKLQQQEIDNQER